MNQFVPDCTSDMGDAFVAPLGCGEDDGLMELLWCNGHVVMQSQAAPRKPPPPRSDKEEEAAAAWFPYPAVEEEDALERDLFSELFGDEEAAPADPPGTGRASKAEPPEEEQERDADDAVTTATTTHHSGLMMPPPKTKAACVLEDDVAAADAAGGESSMLTIGASFCGSNHVRAAMVRGGKRKQQRDDAAETEDVEFESAAVTCEPAQKATTAKRRRAAEVHNLSERRRRDRINEKMKALQELIPHCNKTDKASMLDEAIEYLKSLQLQLQVMWMGGGMAMFPAAAGAHQYMQRVVGPPRMPPFMAPADDAYARCLAADGLPPGPMGMSLYQQPVVPGGSLPAATTTAGTFPSDSNPHKEHENSSETEIKEVSTEAAD